MMFSKIGQRRQITIPKAIFDEMRLKEGEYLEVYKLSDDELLLKKKKTIGISEEIAKGVLLPAPFYEERMRVLESMQENANDESEDIDLDFIKRSRTNKELTISFDLSVNYFLP